jgi:hypothetical protein
MSIQKSPRPNNNWDKSYTPAVPPEFIRITRIHSFCAHLMHTSMITGEVPDAPTIDNNLTSNCCQSSDCPHKSIQHSRRYRNFTACGSLGTPDAPFTILTHWFIYVIFYIVCDFSTFVNIETLFFQNIYRSASSCSIA